ncbi:MAG: helix-turn-helix domain-containing protein [Dehalococcoidia bacterium]|nr:helix-turn-helix domain-containing protein [Dehalococcoidia bacterium]
MTGLGSWLVEAREARGLTLEDAERDTRISRRYLQALEEEQFTVIPAPVYARGFLRSYSQYLGLDPQEAMARYPREEDAYAPPVAQTASGGRPQTRQQPRPSRQPAGQEAGRPTWKRPTPIRGTGEGVVPAPAPPEQRREDDWEPMIGVDIGVPVPTRRLDRDPAAPARTAVVVLVAVAAIVMVVLLALFLSRAGGGDSDGGIIPNSSNVEGAGADGDASGDGASGATDEAPTSTISAAVAGIVPEVRGLTQDTAIAEIRAAGFLPNVQTRPSNEDEGIVFDQSPAPNTEGPGGSEVTILVSEGPE